MVTSRVRLCIFSLLVLGNLTAPQNPSILQFSVQTVSIGMSAIYFHFFRKFLSSGPPASETVNHAMFRSLSFLAQATACYIYTVILIGNVIPGYMKAFIHQHPTVACEALTSRTSIAFPLNLMLITFFKLVVLISPQMITELHHEKTAKYMLISCMSLIVLEQGFEIVYQGTTCIVEAATVVSNFAGLQVEFRDFGKEESSLVITLIRPVLLIISLLNYFAAFVIQALRKRKTCPTAPQVTRQALPVANTECVTLQRVRRHTQVAPTSPLPTPAENNDQANERQDEIVVIPHPQLGLLNKKILNVFFRINFVTVVILLIIGAFGLMDITMYSSLMGKSAFCLFNSLPFLWVQNVEVAREYMDRKVKIFLGLNDDLSPLSRLKKRLHPVHEVQKQLDDDVRQRDSTQANSRRACDNPEMMPPFVSTSIPQAASLPSREGTSVTQF